LGSFGAIYHQSVALMYSAVAAMHLGLHEEARDSCIQACALQRRASPEIRDPWPYLFLGKAYLRLRQPQRAIDAVAPIRSYPDRSALQMLPVVVGEALLQQGDAAAAQVEVMAACSGGSPRLQRLAACVMARAQLSLGQTSEALSTIERALGAPTSDGLESEIDLMNLRVECLLEREQLEASRLTAARTRDIVLGMAADIEDSELRRSFLQNVAPCARALERYEELS
jgi:hypothetical protein